jgi:predicted permease
MQDLRFAARQLRKTPGVTLLAILTLALGIGANTAIFTVIESVLLRPLPYANSERLVSVAPVSSKGTADATSWLNYSDLRAGTHALEEAAGYSEDVGVVESPKESVSVAAPHVTVNAFAMLGAQPLLGRVFTDAEGQANGPQVVILSEGLWRGSFSSDPGIVGKTVRMNGKAQTVVGVMPARFRFPEGMGSDLSRGVWLPMQPTKTMLTQRGYDFFNMVAKRREGASLEQAQQQVNAVAAHLPHDADSAPEHFRVTSYQTQLTGEVRPVLLALFAALGLVLLIACANVSNLMIARCLGRRQEFAVRAALGAGRARLVRQMFAEGLLLSVFGSVAGAGLAQLGLIALRKLPEDTIPRANELAIHWTVLAVLAVIAILSTVFSSALPGVLASRANPQAALQSASRGLGARAVSGRLTGWMVVGQVALSALLLVGTGLLFRTLWNLERAHLGFDAEHLTTFSVMPADAAGFSGMAVSEDTDHAPASVASLVYRPLLDEIRRAPGVESAALVTAPPLSGMNLHSSFEVVGQPSDAREHRRARVTAASGGYARAMGTPIVQGRMIADSDSLAAPFVVVVNESLAKKYFSKGDAVGHRLNLGGKDTGMIKPYTIVGVIGDQIDQKVGVVPEPFLLLPCEQIPTTSLFYQALLKTVVSFAVRTHADVPVAAEMRAIFHQNAPGYALDDFATMHETVAKNTFNQRLGLYLVGSFAGLAVMLVFAGLYGVLSQLVGYRRREIGLRVALGASRQSIARMVLRSGAVLVGAGLVAGLALALAMGRLLKSFLYEVKPADAGTYVAVALALGAIGLLAALIPARRALAIEPMEALRDE